MLRTLAALVTASLLLVAAACGTGEPASTWTAPPGATDGAAGAEESAAPGSGTDPGSRAQPRLREHYPRDGVRFPDLPRQGGEVREAMAAYVRYERGMQRLLRQGSPNPSVRRNAAPKVRERATKALGYLHQSSAVVEGTTRVGVSVGLVDDREVYLELCLGVGDLELVGASGRRAFPTRLGGQAGVLLQRRAGSWKVVEYAGYGAPCS